jgi:hypothetical protein
LTIGISSGNRDYAQAHMAGENYCLSGVGGEATDLASELWKLQESGSEQFRGDDRVHGYGGDTLFAEQNASCDSPHVNFPGKPWHSVTQWLTASFTVRLNELRVAGL